MSTTSTLETAALADQLERSFRGGAWHGPSVSEVLTGVDAALAQRIPEGARHNILELAGHIGFWLEAASERITDPDAAIPENDWPSEDRDGGEASWEMIREKLEGSYKRLFEVVRELDDEQLGYPVSGTDSTVRGLLLGLLQHNAYHAGQIMQIVKATEVIRP